MDSEAKVLGAAPYFVVRELARSVDYYHRKLGFRKPRLWGDPADFAMPDLDGQIVMLKQAPEDTKIVTNRDQGGFWDAYFWVQDGERLFERMEAAGAEVEYAPRLQEEYGNLEFAVRDPDGYVIAFGENREA